MNRKYVYDFMAFSNVKNNVQLVQYKEESQEIVKKEFFPQLTCRMSFDGITMTKLSGKRPRRPFSSPSHQPSSSVS